ncbi:Noc2-domain-containing protein [Hygrophoropsis aurantiaca]|uniref:Noc2-domain-containing protein n=1 Tax=Hygrophoropsis aurantiaca TaxID=72124 RepID=A0ACB8A7W3_9AGAM|nr:Noc2-domain-containing protein [Hygrophoropsis aurantiaca]
MGKASKSTRKFASSGQLKKTIQSRKKHQQIQKKIQGRRGAKGKGKETSDPNAAEDISEDEEETEEHVPAKQAKGVKSVDAFLGADFMDDEDSDEDENVPEEGSDEDNEDDDDMSDNQSFASIDDLEDEGETHMLELSKLAEKDPDFYKYLQENDRELLDFDATPVQPGDDEDDEEEEEEEEDAEMEDDKLPILTKEILRSWQKALLEHRSLKALRKLLIAFRTAAHMNEEDVVHLWSIDSSTVYNKLITTALKYTPVVLNHHIPYKTQSNGKFKAPTQSAKQKTIQKLILSYFNNIIHLLSQLTDTEILQLAITESANILPYVITSRKLIKLYLKKCLELWSTGEDSVRIAAFLAIRRLASSTDGAIMDVVLKNTYLELVRSSKSTTAHKLPSINLMKNSASEIFCLDHSAAYQHAFGYIRQLAIHLRNSMKVKTKEAYKQVYNWQYVHSVDFWALVLARACDTQNDGESELKALIYPLVQVSLGAIKYVRLFCRGRIPKQSQLRFTSYRLISNSRSFPFHLHIVRSLLHLIRHTRVYIPLSPYLLPILTSTLTSTGKPKSSTLRPLDFNTSIRAPAQYLKTRIYAEGIIEETTFILAEWLASPAVQGSVAFPEIIVPIIVVLRKTLKSGKGKAKIALGKEVGTIKLLIERIEESSRWVEQRRKGILFAPGKITEVEQWEADINVEEAPLGKYVKVQRKAREKRKTLEDKARKGEDEILDD